MKKFILFFTLSMLPLRLFILHLETRPVFVNQTIKIKTDEDENLSYEIIRQAEIFQFKTRTHEGKNLKVSINPEKDWKVFVDGEKEKFDVIVDGIEFNIPGKEWGSTEVLIKEKIRFRHLVDLMFLIALTCTALVFRDRRRPKYLIPAILSFSVVFLTIYIIRSSNIIFEKTNIEKFADLYQRSQYVMGQGSDEIIGDEIVYTLAGYHYFVDKADPTSINFEHPPIGKYLYGLSIRFWERARVISLIMYLVTFLVFSALTYKLFGSKLLTSVTMALFVVEKEVLSLNRTTMLDLPLLLFILLSSISWLLAKKRKIFYLPLGFFLGLAMASKFYLSTLIFIFALLVDLWMTKKTDFLAFIGSLSLSLLTFVLSYAAYFRTHTLKEFIDFQRWVLSWFQGKAEPQAFGKIFHTLFTGKVKAWWDLEAGKIITIHNWTPLWPIYTLALIIGIAFALKKRKTSFVFIWPLLYLLALSLGATSPNLLIIVLPFMILNYLSSLSEVRIKDLHFLLDRFKTRESN